MATAALKRKIAKALKQGFFKDPDDFVDVSDGSGDSVHIVVVSRKFNGRRMKEKNDLIWSELQDRLKADEWGRISLSVGVTPDEIKSL
jgi:stress-induced morphogen